MGRRLAPPLVIGAVLAVAILGSGTAAARPDATWRSITFTFTGKGSGTYVFAPGRVGKTDDFDLTWAAVWRQVPNGGYARLVRQTIGGKAAFVGTQSKDSCKGAVAAAKGVDLQLLPIGSRGKYTLVGAGVPIFGSVAVVPACTGTLGYSLQSGAVGVGNNPSDATYVRHRLAVAEAAIDYANPRSVTELPPRIGARWSRQDGTGAKQTLVWTGKLVVQVR